MSQVDSEHSFLKVYSQVSETIFNNWKAFKNDENIFHFTLKSFFRPQNI